MSTGSEKTLVSWGVCTQNSGDRRQTFFFWLSISIQREDDELKGAKTRALVEEVRRLFDEIEIEGTTFRHGGEVDVGIVFCELVVESLEERSSV